MSGERTRPRVLASAPRDRELFLHRRNVLLIEPFLEDRDGIRWIKDLATEYPRTRILIVSRQSERIYAERGLQAGAAGYWMKNGSEGELLRAVETVAAGKIYASPLITSL